MTVLLDQRAELSPTGRAAVSYTQGGLKVVALHRTVGDFCACGPSCERPGKHPDSSLCPNGMRSATGDPAIASAWWRLRPEANVGLVPGRHLVVVDLDQVEREAELLALLERLGFPRSTYTVATRRGLHRYYAIGHLEHRGELRKLHVAGFEFITGEAAYVVAPPSRIGDHTYRAVSS